MPQENTKTSNSNLSNLQNVLDIIETGLKLLALVMALVLGIPYLEMQKQKTDLENKQIDLENKQIDSKAKHLQFEQMKQQKILLADEIRIKELKTTNKNAELHTYRVTYKYNIQNNSPTPVDVSYTVLEAYQGKLEKPKPNNITIINNIGESYSNFSTPWIKKFCKANTIDKAWRPAHKEEMLKLESLCSTEVLQFGGGTMQLGSSNSTDSSLDFLITAKPTDWIGFRLTIALNGAESKKDKLQRWKISPLSE